MKLATSFVLLPIAVYACINTPAPAPFNRMQGAKLIAHFREVMKQSSSDPKVVAKYSVKMEKTDQRQEEAAAVFDILKGDARSAVTKLEAVEAKWPGNFSTAANLGTAYELTGDNENALKWISTGIQRNPKDHYGTEWLHVVILKAKIEAAKHPQKPIPERLLNLPESFEDYTQVSVDEQWHTIKEIGDALYYQLTERLLFVKPKDPFVADLLYSYAVVSAKTDSAKTASDLLKLAREYGFVDEALLKERERRLAALSR